MWFMVCGVKKSSEGVIHLLGLLCIPEENEYQDFNSAALHYWFILGCDAVYSGKNVLNVLSFQKNLLPQ
jgi:hypothetical protein